MRGNMLKLLFLQKCLLSENWSASETALAPNPFFVCAIRWPSACYVTHCLHTRYRCYQYTCKAYTWWREWRDKKISSAAHFSCFTAFRHISFSFFPSTELRKPKYNSTTSAIFMHRIEFGTVKTKKQKWVK